MEIQAFVTDDETWVPAVDFTDREDSLLGGTLSVPLPSFLTADEALNVVESTDRLIAWATAMKLRALARVEEAIDEESPRRHENQPVRFGGDEAHALAVSEVSTACALSEGTAARYLNDATDLTASQWEVLEAVEAGAISEAHVRIILDQARSLPAGEAEKFATVALQRTRTRQGRRRTPAEFRACLRRLREHLHPESLTARKESAQRERGVWFSAEPDGMCTLTARLAAEVGLAIFTGLDQDARQAAARAAERRALPGTFAVPGPYAPPDPGTAPGPGAVPDSRTLPELRADALAYRLFGGTDELFGGTDGSAPGTFRAEVVVTIPVGHVLGGVIESAEVTATAGPAAAESETAELEGYGPLDAATARRLAALAPTWQRLFTDRTTGQALGVGRTAYRPPKALRRYLNSRDGTCRFPGCTRRATACEPDHTIEWQDGGTTDPGNLAMLCRKHHALKSIGAWSYTQSSPTGDLEWRSPLGREYSTEPADFGMSFRSSDPPERTLKPAVHSAAPEPPPF
jgi:AraC-like DNA-binding protein